MRKQLTSTALAALLTTAVLPQAATAQPLKRDLASYFIFAQRSVQLKDISVDNACNIGVNCAKPNANSNCGVAGFEKVFNAVPGSQLAADDVNFSMAGAKVWQLFTNGSFVAANVDIQGPLHAPEPFTLPIIPGTCGPNCTPSPDLIRQACGSPSPFPACGTGTVVVQSGSECIGAPDAVSNGECDLVPGTYGDIIVKDDGRLNLSAGNYNLCSLLVGKGVVARGNATVLNIDSTGRNTAFRVSNESNFGGACGDFKVFVKGNGDVQIGKSSTVAAAVCAPESSVGLGHRNVLIGQFIGDQVNADRSNHGVCCDPGKCTCVDTFSPLMAKVGDIVTFNSGCDLNNATGVKICGVDAPIQTKSSSVMTVKVGVGTPVGPCAVEVASLSGTFKTLATITIKP
jgi:hypothetical protein